jgi:hypothetical protein
VDLVFRLTMDENTLRLRRTHSRVPWVPSEVVLDRQTEPVLHHVLASERFGSDVIEVANRLDGLNVPTDSSATVAMAALKSAGAGRRKALVLDALKLRRQRQ